MSFSSQPDELAEMFLSTARELPMVTNRALRPAATFQDRGHGKPTERIAMTFFIALSPRCDSIQGFVSSRVPATGFRRPAVRLS